MAIPARLKRWSFWLKFFGWSMLAGFVLGLIALIAIVIYVIRVTDDLPSIEELRDYAPPIMTRVHAGDGKLIQEYAEQSRVYVPAEAIPSIVKYAYIAAEDKNFYEHGGIDYLGTIRGVTRTVINRLRGSGGMQSGSTITQQVAKNFLVGTDQTVRRKVREFFIARRMEKAYTKDQILELYLNEIYLGSGAYGVAAASLEYFDKSMDELSIAEVAYLAGIPKGPSNYHPVRNKERALARRNYVIGRMLANGYITEEQAAEARASDLVVSERLTGDTYLAAEYFVEEVRRQLFDTYGRDELYTGGLSVRTTLDTRLQLAARKALRAGLEDYDRRRGYRGPITRIDMSGDWQEALEAVDPGEDFEPWRVGVVLEVSNTSARVGFLQLPEETVPVLEDLSAFAALKAIAINAAAQVARSEESLTLAGVEWARRRTDAGLGPRIERVSQVLEPGDVIFVETVVSDSGARSLALRQKPDVNGGIIAMDPHTGRVLAMVGGYSFRESQFNRTTQARRQPGSAFKPIVYLAALENGYTPVSQVLDAPFVQRGGDGELWMPGNYDDGTYYGPSTLRLGIEKSRNVMTVRLAQDMGMDKVVEIGRRFGIYNDLAPYLPMSLGAGETTLWRMAAAYAALVNGGKQVEPTLIDRVQDRHGRNVFVHDGRACAVCEQDIAAFEDFTGEPLLLDERPRLTDPVTAYQMTSMLEGVVERGTATRVKAVGKPLAGKTGTTNNYVDAWFVGFSADLVVGVYVGYDSPRSLGSNESGGRVAAPIFRDFMADALKDQPAIPFRIPPGAMLVWVDKTTGALASAGDSNAILEAFVPGTEPGFSTGNGFTTFGPGASGPSTTRFLPGAGTWGEGAQEGPGTRQPLNTLPIVEGDTFSPDPGLTMTPPAGQTTAEPETEEELSGLY